jgi:hypothetical protein
MFQNIQALNTSIARVLCNPVIEGNNFVPKTLKSNIQHSDV